MSKNPGILDIFLKYVQIMDVSRMSKKSKFFDISRKHVKTVHMWANMLKIGICPRKWIF